MNLNQANQKTKVISISQPTFLPWIGYFDLIDRSDCFVFFDDAQFSKHSWHQRNKIINDVWITLPIPSGNSHKPLCDINLGKDKRAYDRLFNKINAAYKGYPFYNKYWPSFKGFIESAISENWFLADLNIALISHICEILDIRTKLYRSSKMNISGRRSEKLVKIIKYLDGNLYLSASGTLSYIENDRKIFETANIPVYLHEVEKYNFSETGSLSYLSILDYLFREEIFFFDAFKKTRNVFKKVI